MKRYKSYFTKEAMLSIALVFGGAYVLRVGYLRGDWIMYLVGAALFIAAYVLRAKRR
jgi:hypothetical protein